MDADDVSPLVDRFIVVYTKLASKFGLAGLADNIVRINADFERLLLAMRVAYPDRKHRRFMELCLVRLGWVEPEAFETAPNANASAHGAKASAHKATKEGNAKATQDGAADPAGAAHAQEKADSARGGEKAGAAHTHETKEEIDDGDH